MALRVARRVIANHGRAARRRRALSDRMRETEGAVAGSDPDEVAIEQIAELDPRLRATLRRMEPADREVLLLMAWEDLNAREIAVVLSISHDAARQRVSRARRRVRELYG